MNVIGVFQFDTLHDIEAAKQLIIEQAETLFPAQQPIQTFHADLKQRIITIKKDTSGFIAFFRYFFWGAQKREKLALVRQMEVLDGMIAAFINYYKAPSSNNSPRTVPQTQTIVNQPPISTGNPPPLKTGGSPPPPPKMSMPQFEDKSVKFKVGKGGGPSNNQNTQTTNQDQKNPLGAVNDEMKNNPLFKRKQSTL